MSVPSPTPSSGPSNPLQRAHVLSLQASQLLRAAQPSLAALNAALRQYAEAADLYEAASSGGGDEGKTLKMLVTQHRKLTRDVERKIAALPPPTATATATDGTRTSIGAAGRTERMAADGGANQGGAAGTIPRRAGMPGSPPLIGVGSSHPSGFVNRLSLSPPQGMPPFALRPPPSLGSGTSALPPRLGQGLPPTPSRPGTGTSTSASPLGDPGAGTGISISPTAGASGDGSGHVSARAGQGTGAGAGAGSFSPLYSSSSSSSAPEESYIHFGPRSDDHPLDPFSRFWGMLENMLEEVSNPVVFASAPMDAAPPLSAADGGGVGQIRKEKRGKKKDRAMDGRGTAEESFYVVRKGKERENEVTDDDDDDEAEEVSRPTTPVAPTKTAEELLLENTSLKSSLDALALHAHSLEQTNRSLSTQLEERERGLKVAMEGIKREAIKGQEMLRSQLLGSVISTSSRAGTTNSNAGRRDSQKDDLTKRIRGLEEEVGVLRGENEKQKSQIDKYKERFEKIKINARIKKEAKAKLAHSNGGEGNDLSGMGSGTT